MSAISRTLKTTVALAASVGFVSAASAGPVSIDLFDDPWDPGQSAQTTGVGTASSSMTGLSGVIGGGRDLIVQQLNTVGNKGAVAQVGFGQFDFSAQSQVIAKGTIQWDGNDGSSALDATGLSNFNLLGALGCPNPSCGVFSATVLFADAAFTYEIRLYTDASNYSVLTANTLFDVNSPYTSTYSLDWFTQGTGNYISPDLLPYSITKVGSGVDLTDLGAIEFVLNSDGAAVAVDLSLNDIRAVPEPGSLVLAGVGLLGLAGLRRRKSA